MLHCKMNMPDKDRIESLEQGSAGPGESGLPGPRRLSWVGSDPRKGSVGREGLAALRNPSSGRTSWVASPPIAQSKSVLGALDVTISWISSR